MLTTGALLVFLSVLTVNGIDPNLDYYYVDYDVDVPTDAPDYIFDVGDWLMDLLNVSNGCDPNPCFHGGSCQNTSMTEFTCSCPEPYVGKRCQKVRNVCQGIICGHGDHVADLKKPPYCECKCRPPFIGPDCKTLPASPCEPNPCQNGGSCVKGKRRFRCTCPDGYMGKFCEIAPNDCYVGNGDTYKGAVSVTEEGDECLDWHSYSITVLGEDPFTTYSDFPHLEYNNHCRNPDGDQKPWCFIKKRGRLQWGYCKVKTCSEGTAPAPFSQCGKIESSQTSRIFGGIKSPPGAIPWQASLQSRPKGSSFKFKHICGGTLLNSCWVLTAAHCILPNNDFQVVLGGVNIDKQEEIDQTIPVIETIVYEDYKETAQAVYNDIALLKLKVTDSPYCAKETPYVKSVCLLDDPFPAGKECVISGWGATETQSYSSLLLSARVLLISQEQCSSPEVYGSVLDSSMLCAGYLQGGIDTCQGDSGGPLTCEQGDTHYIAGVTSWGQGCALKNKPGVYANVYTFLDWIKSKMN